MRTASFRLVPAERQSNLFRGRLEIKASNQYLRRFSRPAAVFRVLGPNTVLPGALLAAPGSEFGLQNSYVLCLPAFGAPGDGKFHRLAFRQAAKTAGLDRGEMHKHVSLATVTGNESKSFCVVKPLHNTLFHFVLFLCCFDIS